MVNEATGRVHPSLWATGVKSGRFSCSNPNMQGVSKDHADDDIVQIRELFVPAKGNVLTAADYSQIELRIAASLSQEPVWCDAYNAGDIDMHTQTASKMYKVPFTKVIKDQRDIAKTVNFSILIGISAYTLSAHNRKTIPTQEVAQGLIDSWFDALPRLTEWIDEIKRRARVRGEMKTYFGRIRPFPEIRNPKPESIARRIKSLREREWAQDKDYDELVDIAIRSLLASFERKALSHIIQGTAADIMKIAILNVDKALRKEKMPVKMLLTVHDELLFEHTPKISDEFHALLQETMTFKQLGPGWVPLTVDIGCGANWAEAH
jgi:DNA polymerase-1